VCRIGVMGNVPSDKQLKDYHIAFCVHCSVQSCVSVFRYCTVAERLKRNIANQYNLDIKQWKDTSYLNSHFTFKAV